MSKPATETDIKNDIQSIGRMLNSKYQLASGDMSPEDADTLRIIIENYLIANQ